MVAEENFSEKLKRLDEAVAQLPQLTMKLSHSFIRDPDTGLILYVREVMLPALPFPDAAIYTTRTHRKESPFAILQGRVIVVDDKGKQTEMRAGHRGVNLAGTKRAIIVLEDTVWATYHITKHTNVAEIERELAIEPDAIRGPDGSCCIPDEQPFLFVSDSIADIPQLK